MCLWHLGLDSTDFYFPENNKMAMNHARIKTLNWVANAYHRSYNVNFLIYLPVSKENNLVQGACFIACLSIHLHWYKTTYLHVKNELL